MSVRWWAGLLSLLVAVAPAVASAEDVGLRAISPRVERAALPWLAPAAARVGGEIEAVERSLAVAGSHTRLRLWAVYGSGLLRHVVVGRDLDTMAVFDLGRVAAGEAGTRALLDRVAEVLRAFEARGSAPQDAGLAQIRVGGREGLTSARVVPGSVPGDVVLPVDPRVQYLSDLVRSREAMPRLVREIAVQLFFTATAVDPCAPGSERRVLLLPSHGKTARPINFRDLVYFAAFPSAAARARFLDLLSCGPDLFSIRSSSAAGLLDATEHELEGGDPHKALKRLHQAFDLLAPALVPSVRDALDLDLSRWLAAPAATLLHDLAQTAGKLVRTPQRPVPLSLFSASGDLDAIRSTYGAVLSRWAEEIPGPHSLRLRDLRLHLQATANSPDGWASVASEASSLAATLGPREGDVRRWLAVLRDALFRAPSHRPAFDADDARLEVR